MAAYRVLLAEDEPVIARKLSGLLSDQGYEVVAVAASERETLQKATDTGPDLVLVDAALPGEADSIETTNSALARLDIPVVYLSVRRDAPHLQGSDTPGLSDLLAGPFSALALRRTVEMAVHKQGRERRLKERHEALQQAHAKLQRCGGAATVASLTADDHLRGDSPDHRRVMEALSQSEANYSLLMHSLPVAMGIIQDGRFAFANAALLETFGCKDAAELLSCAAADLIPEREQDRLFGYSRARFGGTTDVPERYDSYLKRLNGEEFAAEVSVRTVTFQGRQALEFVIQDISDRKRAVEALRESREMLDGIIGSITDAMCMIDHDYTIIWANDVAKSLFGSDLVPKKCYEALPKGSRPCRPCAVSECFSDGNAHDLEIELREVNGTKMVAWCTANVAARHKDGSPRAVVQICRDVTRRKRAEELLLQSERLRAVSGLAAGVAHNFKNLLQVIMSAARLALTDLELQDHQQLRSDLEDILRNCRFGAGTVRRMEDFARLGTEDTPMCEEVFDVSATMEQALAMTKPWWKSQPQNGDFGISLTRSLQSGALVKGSESELFEVFVNLVKNAAEALPQGGDIAVSIVVDNNTVAVKVQDSGVGIRPDNLGRIFEPFWTTKEGHGTGMGLAGSLGIVRRHRGEISAESAPGKGSTFTVRLPLEEVRTPDTDSLSKK